MDSEERISKKLKIHAIQLSLPDQVTNTCMKRVVEDLNKQISKYSLSDTIESRSASVREVLKNGAQEVVGLAWVKTPAMSLKVFSNISMPSAIFQLDGTFSCQKKCGGLHTADFVLCLNNREAIGTNFLKLEISHQRRILESQISLDFDSFHTSVLLTLSRSVLDLGKWDGAYGDSYEHQEAFQKAYKGILKSNFVILSLDIE